MKRGVAHERLDALDRGIEALGVADRQRRRRARRATRSSRSASAVVASSASRRARGRRVEERFGDLQVRSGRRRNRHGVDLPEQTSRQSANGACRTCARHFLARAPRLMSDDADELDAGQSARIRAWCRPRCPTPMTAILIDVRPTTTMPASSADAKSASRSKISVLPGVDRQHRGAGAAHRLNRRQTDDRHVEAHVLLRLGHLDDGAARSGEIAGARDHLVGALHRLDRDDRLVLDGDRLADVQRRRSRRPCDSRSRDPSAVPRSARARSSTPAPRQQRLQQRRRIEQLDAPSLHDVGDRGNERIGVARTQPRRAPTASLRSGTTPPKIFVCLT